MLNSHGNSEYGLYKYIYKNREGKSSIQEKRKGYSEGHTKIKMIYFEYFIKYGRGKKIE